MRHQASVSRGIQITPLPRSADGFYERPEKNKPRLIALKDNEPFAFAGVWERRQPNGGEKLETFSILTCPPNEFMADIHNHMPVILATDVSDWLGETKATDTELQSLCAPPPEHMTAWPVSARVGNVKNDDAQLVQPLANAAVSRCDVRPLAALHEPYANLYVGDYFSDTLHLTANEHRVRLSRCKSISKRSALVSSIHLSGVTR